MDFDRLDAILKARGISRRKLALAVGINEYTMATAFRRKSGLSSDEVRRIAEYLGEDYYYLEGWNADKSGQFYAKTTEITQVEADIIVTIPKLNEAGQSRVLQYVFDLLGNPSYQRKKEDSDGEGQSD